MSRLYLPRPVRTVDLGGGATAHVRDLTIRELRDIDRRNAELGDGEDRPVRAALVVAAFALAYESGHRVYDDADDATLVELEGELTPDQLRAIAEAALPSAATAKKD